MQGKKGVYKLLNKPRKHIKVSDYKIMTESAIYRPPSCFNDYAKLEKMFWENIGTSKTDFPIYGADVLGSITDKTVNVRIEYVEYW